MPRESVVGVAVSAFAVLSLLILPGAADQYQPIRAVAAVVCAGIVIVAAPRARAMGRDGRIAVGLLATVMLLVVVSALAASPASSLWGVHGRFNGVASLAVLGLVGIAGYTGSRSGRVFSRVLVGVVLVQAVIIVVQRVTASGLPDGSMGNSALAGAWMAVAVAAAAGLAAVEQGPMRRAALVAVGLGLLALGMLGARSAWIGVVLGLSAALALGARERRHLLISAGAVVLLVIGMLAGGSRALEKADPSRLLTGSAQTRLLIWEGAADMVADQPVLGVGPGRFLYEFPGYQPVEHAALTPTDARTDAAHSVLLQTAAESGVPAAAAALGLWGVAVWAALKAARARNGVAVIALAGLVAYGGQAIFGIRTIETDALAWFLGGVALSAAAGLSETKHPAEGGSGMPERAVRGAAVALAAILAVGIGGYLVAESRLASGLDSFASADFRSSAESLRGSVSVEPLTDIRRVALADTLGYMEAGGEPGAAAEALESVDEGLRLEPGSFDLLATRARAMALSGADPRDVMEAYDAAAAAFPLGLGIRQEAGSFAESRDLMTEAAEYAEAVADIEASFAEVERDRDA